MENKIKFVESTFDFIFNGSFEDRLQAQGNFDENLELWYGNAKVYEAVVKLKPVDDDQRENLLTMIEALRLEVMHPPYPGEPHNFDLTAYEFSEDLITGYKEIVVSEIFRLEEN